MDINKPINIAKSVALACVFSFATTFASANEILGEWKTEAGDLAIVSECESLFCINMETGKFAGKLLAKFEVAEEGYSGTVYNPAGDNEFSGTANISDNILQIKACPVAFLCKTQKWTRM